MGLTALERLSERLLCWLVSRGWTPSVAGLERIAAPHAVFHARPAETAATLVGAARHVTRDVDPSVVRDLFDAAPRATVAFVERGAVELLPAWARVRADTHEFAVRIDDASDLEGREVVLLRDDGAYWFELRGISIRGLARRIDLAQPGESGGLAWYAVEPRRVLAWDYGAIRYA